MVNVHEADAASLAKGVLAPTRTIVATLHETLDRPGSSGCNCALVLAPRAKLGPEPAENELVVYSRR